MVEQAELTLTFDLRTIEHLGIQMYKTLPPVLSEMISNAYDADATFVNIKLIENDNNKQIIIIDDGCGMSFEEINNSFLVIGRNRRKSNSQNIGLTPKGRKVTGRKGLGKLAIFGIATHIEIQTIKDGKENIFAMDLNDILDEKNDGIYKPQIIKYNEDVTCKSGTKITLSGIKRKNPIDILDLKASIAKRFAFDVSDFIINISNESEEIVTITNDTKWEYINSQFEWIFDDIHCKEDSFLLDNKITGKIVTTKTPLPEEQRGVFLYARGKLVNANEFYGIKTTTSLAYNYMTGVFFIDYVDDSSTDLVTTNREGLIWEREELQNLKAWLVNKLQFVEKQWSEKRTQLKEDEISKVTGYKPSEWIGSLPKRKQKLAKGWIDSIYKDNSIDENKAGELIDHLQMCLNFDSFDDMITDLENSGLDEVKVLDLFKEWHLVEAQELYNLSRGRIKAIQKLEQFINEDAKEVPTIHNFIKEFPWILDPKMTIYKDECTYSTLLQEHFPENNEVLEEDKRLDFLCTGFGDTLYIVELKRPSCRISQKELNQLLKYHAFIKDHLIGTSESSYHQVASYIIGGSIVGNTEFNMQIEAMKTQRVYIEIYPEMLSRVKNYHKEFIDKYNELQKRAMTNAG